MALYKVCIDPGHGGSDPGAEGPSGLVEKAINLPVAMTVSSLMPKNFQVVSTRTSDTNVSLSQRTVIANSENADIFVSIHCNSSVNRTANGVETYCYQFGGDSQLLAEFIQKELVTATGLVNRGVREGNFQVLRDTKMPSVLVELAFLSNPREESLLRTSAFQKTCAQAIIRGIGGYFMATTVLRKIGLSGVKYNNKEFEAYLIEGKLFVEVKEFATAMGRNVIWDAKSKTAEIRDRES